LCTATNEQWWPVVVSDGAGGAIVAWQDFRSGTGSVIYAQRVLASGAVDPAWPADGRVLCGAANHQWAPAIASDGAGGAIVAWFDPRPDYDNTYAQHVLASGAVDPAWPADGRALCPAARHQRYPAIAPDGAGGAIVTWYEIRSGTGLDIYAQHVLASGAVDPGWPADGSALCAAAGEQTQPMIVSDGAGGAIVTWYDFRSGSGYDIYAQRVAPFGFLGTPEAVILSVSDVPSDEGGQVELLWNASYLEASPYNLVTHYDVFRSVPLGPVATARAVPRSGNPAMPTPATPTYTWEFVATVNANLSAQYSYVAPTTVDSTGEGAAVTAFMIQALGAGGQHWESPPMAGYSVDNVAPATPTAFTGEYAAGTAYLHWSPNSEGDLAGYRLYRGLDISFVPGPGNLVAALPDTGYTDVAGGLYVYKLAAVDRHDNESPFATVTPSGPVGVPPGATSRELAFEPPSPNPARAFTTLQYTLPSAAAIRLVIYDVAGRMVREISRGVRAAGVHAERWDLRESDGRAVSAGLYFATIEVEGRTMVRRVAVGR
jgi:hypothetical protein